MGSLIREAWFSHDALPLYNSPKNLWAQAAATVGVSTCVYVLRNSSEWFLTLWNYLDSVCWQLVARGWGGKKCRLIRTKHSILKLNLTLGCFPSGCFLAFPTFMTHIVVSDTHRAVAEYLRTPYWLNPCVLSRKMPNQLPELQEVELSIIVLDSSGLTGRSAAVGSAAFCRGGEKQQEIPKSTAERVSLAKLWCYWSWEWGDESSWHRWHVHKFQLSHAASAEAAGTGDRSSVAI